MALVLRTKRVRLVGDLLRYSTNELLESKQSTERHNICQAAELREGHNLPATSAKRKWSDDKNIPSELRRPKRLIKRARISSSEPPPVRTRRKWHGILTKL